MIPTKLLPPATETAALKLGRSVSAIGGMPLPPAPATRQGQREIVAATLAAGIIGGQGTPASAVSLWRDVLAEMERTAG